MIASEAAIGFVRCLLFVRAIVGFKVVGQVKVQV